MTHASSPTDLQLHYFLPVLRKWPSLILPQGLCICCPLLLKCPSHKSIPWMTPNQRSWLTHPCGPQCWHCSTSIIFPQNILTLDESFHLLLSMHMQKDRPGSVKNHSICALLVLLLLELILLSSSLSYSSMCLFACLRNFDSFISPF